MKTLTSLTALLAAATAIAIEGNRLAPQKKRDGKDHPVGVLTDDMKKLWLLRAEKLEVVKGIVDSMGDHISAHGVDHTTHGDSIPKEIERKFNENMERLRKELSGPYREFISVDRVFQAGISLEYGSIAPENKGIVGIRKDFEVVYRGDNARSDEDDPVTAFTSQTCKVHTIEFVFTSSSTPGSTHKPN
ncbi:MAG: hypothetical protein RLY57_547 [Candidatus Parcubacteria bacterium]